MQYTVLSWSRSIDIQIVHTQMVQKVENYPNGYPRLAAFMSSDEGFLQFRRFSTLRTRILLMLQNDLSNLEAELYDLETGPEHSEVEGVMQMQHYSLDKAVAREEVAPHSNKSGRIEGDCLGQDGRLNHIEVERMHDGRIGVDEWLNIGDQLHVPRIEPCQHEVRENRQTISKSSHRRRLLLLIRAKLEEYGRFLSLISLGINDQSIKMTCLCTLETFDPFKVQERMSTAV